MWDPMRPCALFDVSNDALHEGTDAQLRRDVERLAHWRAYCADETVLAEDDDMVFVGQVISGVLRLKKTMLDGRQQIVGLLLPSDMFGRVFAQTSQFAIEAATDVTVCCFGRQNFEKLLLEHPRLEHRMFLAVLEELDMTREWMAMLGAQTVPERIASFLKLLHRRQNRPHIQPQAKGNGRRIDIPISRRDIAACLGTTAESISRTLKLMERENIIRRTDRQHIEFVNEQRSLELRPRKA